MHPSFSVSGFPFLRESFRAGSHSKQYHSSKAATSDLKADTQKASETEKPRKRARRQRKHEESVKQR